MSLVVSEDTYPRRLDLSIPRLSIISSDNFYGRMKRKTLNWIS